MRELFHPRHGRPGKKKGFSHFVLGSKVSTESKVFISHYVRLLNFWNRVLTQASFKDFIMDLTMKKYLKLLIFGKENQVLKIVSLQNQQENSMLFLALAKHTPCVKNQVNKKIQQNNSILYQLIDKC